MLVSQLQHIFSSCYFVITEPESIEAAIVSNTPEYITIWWSNTDSSHLPPIQGYLLIHTSKDRKREIILPSNVFYYTLAVTPYSLHMITITSFNVLGSSEDALLSVVTKAAGIEIIDYLSYSCHVTLT